MSRSCTSAPTSSCPISPGGAARSFPQKLDAPAIDLAADRVCEILSPWTGAMDRAPVDRDGTETETGDLSAAISPDGRWPAFESDRSGPREVFVRPFSDVDRGLWQISSGGGRQPAWSRDGAELCYVGAEGGLMSTRVSAQGGALPAAPPQQVLEPG